MNNNTTLEVAWSILNFLSQDPGVRLDMQVFANAVQNEMKLLDEEMQKYYDLTKISDTLDPRRGSASIPIKPARSSLEAVKCFQILECLVTKSNLFDKRYVYCKPKPDAGYSAETKYSQDPAGPCVATMKQVYMVLKPLRNEFVFDGKCVTFSFPIWFTDSQGKVTDKIVKSEPEPETKSESIIDITPKDLLGRPGFTDNLIKALESNPGGRVKMLEELTKRARRLD